MDDYTNLKKNVDQYQKSNYTYSADGKQFNFNGIKNLFIIASNPKTAKNDNWDRNEKDK